MNKQVGELLRSLREENEKLEERNKHLQQQNAFLSTKILDHRYTIKQLKSALGE